MQQLKLLRRLKVRIANDYELPHIPEHCGHLCIPRGRSPSHEASAMRMGPICAGDRVVLRVVDVDGGGGLTTAKNGKICGIR